MVRRLRGRIEMEDGTAAGLDSAERNVKKSTDSIKEDFEETGGVAGELAEKFSGLGPLAIAGAATAAVGGVVALGDALLGRASEIQELSTISGVGAETLQRWGAAARESGGSAEDVADAARELQLRLAEASSLASGPAVDALNLLGLSLEELEGIPVDEQLALIRDRLSEVHDPAQRAVLGGGAVGWFK